MITVQHIPAYQASHIWDTLAPEIDRAVSASHRETSIDVVRDSVLQGAMSLWVILSDGKYAGVGVTEILPTGGSKPWLNVVFLATKPGLGPSVFREGFMFIEDHAASLGLRGVKYFSSIPSFSSAAKRYGYEKRFVEYVKEF